MRNKTIAVVLAGTVALTAALLFHADAVQAGSALPAALAPAAATPALAGGDTAMVPLPVFVPEGGEVACAISHETQRGPRVCVWSI